jgi:hypothetical protein
LIKEGNLPLCPVRPWWNHFIRDTDAHKWKNEMSKICSQGEIYRYLW